MVRGSYRQTAFEYYGVVLNLREEPPMADNIAAYVENLAQAAKAASRSPGIRVR